MPRPLPPAPARRFRLPCVLVVLAILAGAATEATSRTLQPAASSGSVRALVIGIDTYKHPDMMPTLAGAVRDARDIAGSLESSGVRDLTVLVDGAATRAAITRAFRELISRTRAGDLVVVTFAGHGSQDKEMVPGSEPDGLDEYFVLHGFGPGPDAAERIVDDQMFHWLRQLSAKGAETVFLADSCFGGGMTKAADPRAGRGSVRRVTRAARQEERAPGTFYIEGLDEATRRQWSAEWAADEGAAMLVEGLTFIGAVDSQTEVPEVAIAGEATLRGAASYALARLLAGDAADASGGTTRHAAMVYIESLVQKLSLHRQVPVVEPQRAVKAQELLFRHGGRPAAAPPVSVTAKPAPATPAPSPAPAQGGAERPGSAQLVTTQANLFFDPRTGDMLTPMGDVLAYGVGRSGIGAAVERYEAFARLARIASRRPLELKLTPALRRPLASGERFTVATRGVYGEFIIVANLAGDGTFQLIYPRDSAAPRSRLDDQAFQMYATAPFGSDTFIVVAAATRQRELELSLELLDGQRRPSQLAQALEQHLGADARVGLLTYETRP